MGPMHYGASRAQQPLAYRTVSTAGVEILAARGGAVRHGLPDQVAAHLQGVKMRGIGVLRSHGVPWRMPPYGLQSVAQL